MIILIMMMVNIIMVIMVVSLGQSILQLIMSKCQGDHRDLEAGTTIVLLMVIVMYCFHHCHIIRCYLAYHHINISSGAPYHHIIIPGALYHHFIRCSLVETTFILLVTVSTVNLLSVATFILSDLIKIIVIKIIEVIVIN